MNQSQLFRTARVLLITYLLGGGFLFANPQEPPSKRTVRVEGDIPAYRPSVPKPTLAGVHYGLHERQILDFWQAESASPTPLVMVVHGGAWNIGSKEIVHKAVNVNALLKEGISVVAINYRLLSFAEGIEPPVKAPMHDAARALQFVRSKATTWNIDPTRIGASGVSAGACTSLWLAYHDDLADSAADDPVARESTRLWCAAVISAQTSLDPRQMKEWIPNIGYGAHAFGFNRKDFSGFLSARESILPWIAEYSPYGLVTVDDPPVFLYYRRPPTLGKDLKDPTHSANFGVKIHERCTERGVQCTLFYPGVADAKYKTPTDYLIATLKAQSRKPHVIKSVR